MLVILLYLNKSRNLQTPPNLSPPTGTYSMPSAPACAKRCTRPAFSGYLGLGSSASGSGCASYCRVPWPCCPSAPRHRPSWRQYPCRWRRFPGPVPAHNTWHGWRREQTAGGSFHRRQPASPGRTSVQIPKRVTRAAYRSRRTWRQKCRFFVVCWPFVTGLDMDVVLQLVVFLVGRIALFGQFYQQLRRALAMLRSGTSVLVHQRSLNQLAQIGFSVHQLLQQGHK